MAAFRESLWDKVTGALYPVMRKLNDVNIALMGSKTMILKVNRPHFSTSQTLWSDDKEDTFFTNITANSSIRYPSDKIEIIQQPRDSLTGDVAARALQIEDIIPIEMIMQWEGDDKSDPIKLAPGDLVVDIHFGQGRNETIPIILEIEKILGFKFGKYITQKIAQLAKYRGEFYDPIKLKVDEYIANINVEV